MITKGKKGLVWVFNEHFEHTVNAMVVLIFRKYRVRQIQSHFLISVTYWKTSSPKGTMPPGHTNEFVTALKTLIVFVAHKKDFRAT